MPTENRRIAAYLPQHIDEKLEAFKSDRGLKGDSQALVVILSEFFGVSQQVAHPSSATTEQVHEIVKQYFCQIEAQLQELGEQAVRIEGMESRLSSLERWRVRNEFKTSPSESPDELLNRVSRLESHLEKTLIHSPSQGQLNLLDDEESSIPTVSETSVFNEEQVGQSELGITPEGLKEGELAKRLKRGNSTIREWRSKGSEVLAEKTRKLSGIAWRYDTQTKRYYPIPNAESLNQVNPEAPEGSEQSGEG